MADRHSCTRGPESIQKLLPAVSRLYCWELWKPFADHSQVNCPRSNTSRTTKTTATLTLNCLSLMYYLTRERLQEMGPTSALQSRSYLSKAEECVKDQSQSGVNWITLNFNFNFRLPHVHPFRLSLGCLQRWGNALSLRQMTSRL